MAFIHAALYLILACSANPLCPPDVFLFHGIGLNSAAAVPGKAAFGWRHLLVMMDFTQVSSVCSLRCFVVVGCHPNAESLQITCELLTYE